VLRKELNLAALDTKYTFLKIDACLVCLQHIQTKEKINISTLVGGSIREIIGDGSRCDPHTSIIVKEHGR